MRRSVRIFGTVLAVSGALILVWALVVWQWQDPFTALYTKWKQHQLAGQYQKRVRSFAASISHTSLAAERKSIAREAKRYRFDSTRGQAIGRLRVPRMGVNMILVNGTDHDTLTKGPGRRGSAARGRVVFHGPDRDEVYAKALELPSPRHIAFHCTKKRKPGVAYIL